MVRLSVNVNKVATLRNSRGGALPSPLRAAQVCVAAGAHGITVHPRADERHIRLADVRELAAWLAPLRDRVEFNVEGDPRADLMDLLVELRPHQATLVPVSPGEITSQAGWSRDLPAGELRRVITRLRGAGVRVSLFVDPDPAAVDWAASLGAERVELFTEPYARAFAEGPAAGAASFSVYAAAARHAHARGLGVNAGHDLDQANLPLFATLPHLAEVSIGHALLSDAVFDGLATTVRAYLAALAAGGAGGG